MLIDVLKAEINRQVAELAEQVDGDTTALAAKIMEVSQRKDIMMKEYREQEAIANELGVLKMSKFFIFHGVIFARLLKSLNAGVLDEATIRKQSLLQEFLNCLK